jgi:hypothetical protein
MSAVKVTSSVQVLPRGGLVNRKNMKFALCEEKQPVKRKKRMNPLINPLSSWCSCSSSGSLTTPAGANKRPIG